MPMIDNDFIDMFANDSFDFREDWLSVKDYQLKILLLTSVLADNNLAYRGNLKTMCEWLGVTSAYKNNQKIKQAISELENNGLIFCKVEGRTYHLSISNKGMKSKRIIRLRKAWVNTFKEYNKDENGKRINNSISIDWIKILKVFIYLFNNPYGDIFTMKQLAEHFSISVETATLAVNAIMQSELKGITSYKDTVKEEYKDSEGNIVYRTVGTRLSIGYNFEDI